VAKVRAEDGSWGDPSYYDTPATPPTPSTSGKKKTAPATFLGEAQVPSGARSGGNCRVIRSSGASLVARVPSHITVRDGDTVRVQRESLESTSVAAKGTFVIIENLDHSPQANPVADVDGSTGSTVGGSTSGAPGLPSVSTSLPDLNIVVPADAGNSTNSGLLNAVNDNRQVLRDINTRLSFVEVAIKALQLALSETVSALSTETGRTSSVASRVSSVESSVNATKAVVDDTKESVNKVNRALKRAGVGFADKDYGGGIVSGMVTRRNMMTDYARVRVNSEAEENAFIGGFQDLVRGDYVKVNTSGGSGTWFIEDYMDPADIGLD